jgi:Fe2+ or Zn2+ uptake regulation protein
VDNPLVAELRQHELRVTPQRRAILGAFAPRSPGHLTADEVYERARRYLPELARATVYNTLGEFVRAGLLSVVEGLGAARYDRNVETHHHFRCLECGELYDVHPRGVDRLGLDDSEFRVRRTRILLEGTCPRCRSESD